MFEIQRCAPSSRGVVFSNLAVVQLTCSLATVGVSAKDSAAMRKRIIELEAKLLDSKPAVGSAADRSRVAKTEQQIRAALVELTAADASVSLVFGNHDATVRAFRIAPSSGGELSPAAPIQLDATIDCAFLSPLHTMTAVIVMTMTIGDAD